MKSMKGQGFNFGFMVTGLILFAVGILIAVALLPAIADNTIGIQGTGNITGAPSTLLGLIPLIYVVVPIVIGASFIVKALKV